MRIWVAIYVGAACLAAGLVAGRCWRGRAADARFMKLETAYGAHLRADSVANAQDGGRSDTVRLIIRRVVVDSAAADSLSGALAGQVSEIRARITDSTRGVFDAWVAAVTRRDSLRVAEIAGLTRIVAIQDSQLVALRFRVQAGNALLAQAMGVARALGRRSGARWRVTLGPYAGYGLTLVTGTPAWGPQLGAGVLISCGPGSRLTCSGYLGYGASVRAGLRAGPQIGVGLGYGL